LTSIEEESGLSTPSVSHSSEKYFLISLYNGRLISFQSTVINKAVERLRAN
jgi:hypothetical protein